MSRQSQFLFCLLAALVVLFTACQQNSGLAYYHFPDEVTTLNDVDPAYRKYFEAQNGRNYGADEQRAALAKAVHHARMPVPKYVPNQAAPKRKLARRGKTYTKRVKVARRGKAYTKRSKVARRSKASSRKRVATRKRSTGRRRRG